MTAQTQKKKIQQEDIIDNMTTEENKTEPVEQKPEVAALDEDKLAKLKARLAAKEKETEVQNNPATKREKSINFGVIGSGQCGSKLAETWYKLGCDAIAINTAQHDLRYIEIPESNKLLMEHGLGGAAKELEIGKAAAEKYRDKIAELVSNQLADAQVLILALSLGGGSGAGSCEPLVDVLSAMGKPLVVMTVLPMDSEDAQVKMNSLQTLAKLAKFTQSKKINNLIVVDNAKIESIYNNISQIDFFSVANKAIVEPIDAFNTLSAMSSPVKPLDSMEFAKLFVDGEGLCVYGMLKVSNYKEEDAIAIAMIDNLNSNLLASGFDLKQTKYGGVIITANSKVWKEIPAAHMNYALALVNEQCGDPEAVFKGIYVNDNIAEDCVVIYSMFSGLSLPQSRIEQLKKETAAFATSHKEKNTQRNLSLDLNTGTDQTITKVQEIKNKIAQKTSAFGKLTSSTIIDRRKQ
jgi:tubulin-like protein CetZ